MDEDDDGSLTVSTEGISVQKRIETERFPTLAVELEITSEREAVTELRLVEAIPDDVPAEDVGFHPNFGEQHWSLVDDHEVAFEREVEPGKAYTTIYGFRDFPDDRHEELLSEPVVEVEPVDADPAGSEGTGTDQTDSPALVSDSVVRTIAKELRRGIAGPDERRMLREELRQGEGSGDSRIEELQERVSDFEAYVDALEDFLRAEGTAEQVFDRFTADIDELETELDRLSEEFDPVFEEFEALEAELDEVAEEIESADSRLDDLAEGLDGVDEGVAEIDSQIDGQESEIEDVSSEITGVDDRIDDVTDEISTLERELEDLRRDLRQDVRAIEDDLEDFAALRDRLASVFGSGVQVPGSGTADAEGAGPGDDDAGREGGEEAPDEGSETEETAAGEDAPPDSRSGGDEDESDDGETAEE